MRALVITVIVLVVVGGVVAAGYKPAVDYWEQQSMPKWKTADVAQGTIVSVVNATGTIKPSLQISVGAFVSGPIDAEFELTDDAGNVLRDKDGEPRHIADFNDEVKEKQVLAKIQDTIYKANVARDAATVETKMADKERIEALLYQAKNDEKRSYALRAEDPAFIAQAELDRVRFNRMQLEAQVKLAKAAIDQAQAQLDFSKAQLDYCIIKSPANGIIINRKIDPGQTVAAQFQTPELFILAPDMRRKMYVHAAVDEADIGLIRQAQQNTLPVTFTVDAYSDLFTGTIEEIRLGSTTTQNVVTYPVIVGASNAELKLLPGMTANISFEVDRRSDVLKIPNSALRFFPRPQHVREVDKPLLEGKESEDPANQPFDVSRSAEERNSLSRDRNRRHVWVQDGTKLRAVEVRTGISDSVFTELIAGQLKAGERLITGIQPAAL